MQVEREGDWKGRKIGSGRKRGMGREEKNQERGRKEKERKNASSSLPLFNRFL